MESITTDIQGFFDSLDAFDGEHFTGEAFTSVADSVGCCRIEHLIYSSGTLERQNNVYVTADEHQSEYFEISKDLSDAKKGFTRFYFKKYFPGLSDDLKPQFKLFSTCVSVTLSYRYLEQAVTKLKYYNQETGLPNLHYYAKIFNGYIADGTAGNYIVALVNIKGSARINHFFGSNLASSAFYDFGNKLSAFADKESGEFVAHMGGDNFVAVFRKDRLDDMKAFLNGVKINARFRDESIVYTLAARSGIVKYDDSYMYAMSLITDCMQALSAARKFGEDHVVFEGHIASEKISNKEYTNAIREALDNKKFLVYFQPVISDVEEDVTLFAAEALARWIHNGNICMPQDFINAASETGLMTKIDFYVLDTVCAKVKEWLDQGLEVVPITCNFSNRNLVNEGLADEIIKVIDTYGIDHKYIGIEFNEPNFKDELLLLKQCTKKLKETGILITIDNFGSGLTTLRLLQEVQLDYVKINRDVITSDDERGMIILENMITLADKLGYTVICDGAHEEEDIKRLIQCGCKHFQSFFYEKPLTERFFERRLKNRIIPRRQ